MGDMNHLQHVIYNLLLNAIKFSEHSSKITFELITQKIEGNKHRIIISITDENKPISQSVKDKMFLSYNTSNSNTGTGLGLYICKKIVDLHAGKIYHEFPNITGNKFVIDMQMNICNSMKNDCFSNNSSCKQSGESDKKENKISDSLVAGLPPGIRDNESRLCSDPSSHNANMLLAAKSPIIHHKTIGERSESQLNTARSLGKHADSITDRSVTDKLRIAVVDDSELSRKLLTRLLISHTYLSDKKYKLYESFDGLDAVSSLHNKIDYLSIIFMDNIMPNITGVLASKIIRGFGYDNLIFGITGNGLEEDIDEFINNGADYVFVKPFKKEKLDMVFKFIATYGFARQPGKKIAETTDKKAIMWVEC
jgi:CheY-like chemotaxis protein